MFRCSHRNSLSAHILLLTRRFVKLDKPPALNLPGWSAMLVLVLGLAVSSLAQSLPQRMESLRLAQTTKERATATQALALFYTDSIFNADSATFYINTHLKYAYELADPDIIGQALKQSGYIYLRDGQFKEAIKNLTEARDYLIKSGNKKAEVSTLCYLANIQLQISNHAESIKIAYQAIQLAEPLKLYKQLAYGCTVLSLNYHHLNNFEEAISWANKAVQVATEGNEQTELGDAYRALASSYQRLGNLVETEKNFKKAIQIARSSKSAYKVGFSLLDLAGYFLDINQPDSTVLYCNQALALDGINRSKFLKCNALSVLSRYYLQKKQPKESIAAASEAYDIAVKLSNFRQQLVILSTRAKAYALYNQNAAAYADLSIVNVLADSLFTTELEQKTARLRESFLVEQEHQANAAKLANAEYISKIGWGSAIAGFFFILTLLLSIRSKIRDSRRIKQEAETVRKQKIELENLNEIRNKLMAVLSHDLRAPLFSGEAFLKKMELSANINPGDIRALKNHFSSTLLLTENLLVWAKAQAGDMMSIPLETNLHRLVNGVFEVFSLDAQQKNIELQNQISPDLTVWTDDKLVHIALRNLISNALKFAPENTAITVKSTESADSIQLDITNQGDVTDTNALESALNEIPVQSSDPDGFGIGLAICSQLLNRTGNKLSFVPDPEHHSTTLRISLAKD